MTRRVSRASIIWSIMLKDLRGFPRNPYWVLIGPVALVLLIVSFWLLPGTFPQAVIEVGIYPRRFADSARAAQALARLRTEEEAPTDGLEIVPFESEGRLRAVVSREIKDEETKNVAVGIAFPDDFVEAARTGRKTTVRVHLDGSEEMGAVVSSAVREVAFGTIARDSQGVFALMESLLILFVCTMLLCMGSSWAQLIAKLIPTYWFILPLYQIAVMGAGLADVWTNLLVGLGMAAAMVAPIVLLGRRMQAKLATA